MEISLIKRRNTMLVLGDVFAVVAVLVGLFLTCSAVFVAARLGFPELALRGRDRMQGESMSAFGVGLLAGIPSLLFVLIVSGLPNPAVKALGLMGLVLWLGMALVGASGLVQAMADRIHTLDASVSPFAAYWRATMAVTGAMLFPLVGWLLIAPAIIAVGFGLSVQMLFRRRRNELPVV